MRTKVVLKHTKNTMILLYKNLLKYAAPWKEEAFRCRWKFFCFVFYLETISQWNKHLHAGTGRSINLILKWNQTYARWQVLKDEPFLYKLYVKIRSFHFTGVQAYSDTEVHSFVRVLISYSKQAWNPTSPNFFLPWQRPGRVQTDYWLTRVRFDFPLSNNQGLKRHHQKSEDSMLKMTAALSF